MWGAIRDPALGDGAGYVEDSGGGIQEKGTAEVGRGMGISGTLAGGSAISKRF